MAKSKTIRKPKLAPVKILNSHHIQYLQEKAREQDATEGLSALSVSRPVGVRLLYFMP